MHHQAVHSAISITWGVGGAAGTIASIEKWLQEVAIQFDCSSSNWTLLIEQLCGIFTLFCGLMMWEKPLSCFYARKRNRKISSQPKCPRKSRTNRDVTDSIDIFTVHYNVERHHLDSSLKGKSWQTGAIYSRLFLIDSNCIDWSLVQMCCNPCCWAD